MRASRGTLLKARFWAKVELGDGCWEWSGARLSAGYGQFTVNGRSQGAHRFAWSLVYGPIPPGKSVLHHCDNPSCVRPDHLFVGTQSDNLRDMVAKGRGLTPAQQASRNRPTGDAHWTRRKPELLKRGVGHWKAKLTEDDVRAIRRLRSEGWGLKRLADEYHVSIGTIHFIVMRQTWRHVE